MSKPISIGDAAPDFTLPDADGNPVTLTAQRSRWVVLYFYPRDNTAGCTTQARDFTALLSQFEEKSAVILGVSADSVASHAKFSAKHELGITLLSDPDHQALEAYGVWQKKKMAGREYMGIVRTTFLIDPAGTIRQVWNKVRVKGHAAAVHETLCSLQ